MVEHGAASATVLAGSFLGATSPAAFVTDLLGLDLVLRPGSTALPLRPDFEHAVVALDGEVLVGGAVARPGQIASLGVGRSEVEVQAREQARVLVLGGVPFPEKLFMWWNFVARSADEVSGFYADWRDRGERFAAVDSALARIPAPTPPWEPVRVRPAPLTCAQVGNVKPRATTRSNASTTSASNSVPRPSLSTARARAAPGAVR